MFQISDPPEIEIEQTWYQPNGEKAVEVELLCTVHANPEAEVKKNDYFFEEKKIEFGIEKKFNFVV